MIQVTNFSLIVWDYYGDRESNLIRLAAFLTHHKSKCLVYCALYSFIKIKMLLTVITVLVLCTNRLVVADDQCTHYQFRAPFYPGRSCKDIYIMNPESREVPGYYWIIDSPTNVYCGMNYTGVSCEDIYNNNPETASKNGYYPINNTKWTLCNMTAITAKDHFCAGVEGQWRRIANIKTDVGDNCPTGWIKSSHNRTSFCRVPSDNGGCYSTFLSTNGVSYQHVCGRARGYQKGSPDAFSQNTLSIDTYYVDGLSITHGNPRQHIWTYAVEPTENGSFTGNCPCAVNPGRSPPLFVGNKYYCESGVEGSLSSDAYYLSDPLWDGAGCSANNTCCSNTDQPWFHHQLNNMTQDDIEVRICTSNSFSSNEGILVDILELYIQ